MEPEVEVEVAQEDADPQPMYRIERPVYDEAFIRSQLLRRKDNATGLQEMLARRFRYVCMEMTASWSVLPKYSLATQ